MDLMALLGYPVRHVSSDFDQRQAVEAGMRSLAQARCSYCGEPCAEVLRTPVCAEHLINEMHLLAHVDRDPYRS